MSNNYKKLLQKQGFLKIKNVLMGEVWLAAGQSNMEMTFDYCCNSTDSSSYEIETANFSKIRMYNVKKALSPMPGASPKGHFAYKPIAKQANAAAIKVPTKL